jgi:hypothetical protein
LDLVELDSFDGGSHCCPNLVVSANKYLRKMRGSSQAIFVLADDDKHYVVKMFANPIGRNLLANEYIGNLIARSVGLPVARSRRILLTDDFIDRNPDSWFELPSGALRPHQGMHFGSLFVGQTSGAERPTEYISPSKINTITTREAFLGMYILDVWANHQDNRQAIFQRGSDNSRAVFFIDHGHMFGGPDWNFRNKPGSPLHLEMAVYTNLWQDEKVALWISLFQSVLPDVLKSIPHSMQPEWYKGDLVELIDWLSMRLARLPDLVREDVVRNWDLFQPTISDETLRLSDSRIYEIGAPATWSAIHRDRAPSRAKFILLRNFHLASVEDKT